MITHQGGSSPVQLAMANVMVMHFGQAVANQNHVRESTKKRKEEDQRKAVTKKAQGNEDVQGVAAANTFNRMA